MRIIIDSTYELANGKCGVIAKLENGNLKGIWKGNQIPLKGEIYDVELSFPAATILKCNEIESKISIIGNNEVEFKGTCEDIDDDIYIIRFAKNWIQIVEKINNGIGKGDVIKFVLKDIDILIYPILF